MAEAFVRGADVWLNNPVRPNEASGTSGMKAGMNGVLNLSVLDGWWPECYDGNNGWAITAGDFYTNTQLRDRAEANQIYDLLESEITKRYFDADDNGVPNDWVEMMKSSIYTVASGFGIYRPLEKYNSLFYQPALKNADDFRGNDAFLIQATAAKASDLQQKWDSVQISHFETSLDGKSDISNGDPLQVHCDITFNEIEAKNLLVELVICTRENTCKTISMELGENTPGHASFHLETQIASKGTTEIDVRVVPADPRVKEYYPHLIRWG